MKVAEEVSKVTGAKAGKAVHANAPLKNGKSKKRNVSAAKTRGATARSRAKDTGVANSIVGYGKSTIENIPQWAKRAKSKLTNADLHWPENIEFKNVVARAPLVAAAIGLGTGAIIGMILPRAAALGSTAKKSSRRK